MRRHSVDVHHLIRTFWRCDEQENHCHTFGYPRGGTHYDFPPTVPPPHIRHMVWSMFGSGELLATIMEK